VRNVAWRRDPRGVRLTFNDTIDDRERDTTVERRRMPSARGGLMASVRDEEELDLTPCWTDWIKSFIADKENHETHCQALLAIPGIMASPKSK